MNKDELQGGLRYVGGKVEKAIGDTVKSRDWQVDGVVDQVAGAAQNLYGRARSAIEDAVDGAPELGEKIAREARHAGEQATDAARRASTAAKDSATNAPELWALGAIALGYGVAWLIHARRG
ncbi:hypothetical protein ASE75_01705 [Sphingomonas sp. Leaf17]|uniref:CsbD family protein n=1 Tax=Sphingomonas sp. Leaf17 TaxID=1735683 RepID=UPI0006F65EF3|nr:CsbD family protein [Sphingomonas sp. Leaf17]KQM67671.1 hypothetical protein ASE75_01705 [Sphingomonas sp. Leaf17]